MKPFIRLIVILLALTQAGCAQLIAAQRRADEEKCLTEGFRPGTDGFRLCRLTIEESRRGGARGGDLSILSHL